MALSTKIAGLNTATRPVLQASAAITEREAYLAVEAKLGQRMSPTWCAQNGVAGLTAQAARAIFQHLLESARELDQAQLAAFLQPGQPQSTLGTQPPLLLACLRPCRHRACFQQQPPSSSRHHLCSHLLAPFSTSWGPQGPPLLPLLLQHHLLALPRQHPLRVSARPGAGAEAAAATGRMQTTMLLPRPCRLLSGRTHKFLWLPARRACVWK